MLTEGNFPDDMKELFRGKGGLFPEPRKISFNCSCPDWALMCKHVAAALYGVGPRLDENPLLFFELRGIEWDGLSMWRLKTAWRRCWRTRIRRAAGLWRIRISESCSGFYR